MTTKETDVLYGNITLALPVPSSVEEFDASVGIGECLASGIDDIIYRNTLPRLYRGVAAKYIENGQSKPQATDKSGSPKFNTRKDGSQTPVLVSDIDFIGKLYEEANDEGKAEIVAVFEEVKSSLPFYEKGTGGGGGGRISEAAMQSANGVIAAGTEAIEKIVSAIEERVAGFTVARDPDGNVGVESLARGIQALEKKLVADAKKAAAGILSL